MVPGVWIHIPLEGEPALYVETEDGDDSRIWDWVNSSPETATLVLAAADCMEQVAT